MGGDDDETFDCPHCESQYAELDWNLYCNECDIQFTRKQVDEYYEKLRIDAMNFYTKLYEKQEVEIWEEVAE
ncbi:hypothetical protein KZR37_002879 [Listeria monocytogenes]|nr:hypothetical protein [Listeria monocytogenes]